MHPGTHTLISKSNLLIAWFKTKKVCCSLFWRQAFCVTSTFVAPGQSGTVVAWGCIHTRLSYSADLCQIKSGFYGLCECSLSIAWILKRLGEVCFGTLHLVTHAHKHSYIHDMWNVTMMTTTTMVPWTTDHGIHPHSVLPTWRLSHKIWRHSKWLLLWKATHNKSIHYHSSGCCLEPLPKHGKEFMICSKCWKGSG